MPWIVYTVNSEDKCFPRTVGRGGSSNWCRWLYLQNVNRSESHTLFSKTFQSPSPVFPNTSRCFLAPLKLSKVLSDSSRACSGAPESSCSYDGVFRMLQDLTFRIVKLWSSWDICTGLWETSSAAETAAQLCGRLGATLSQLWFLGFQKHKAFRLSYSFLFQSQDSQPHNIEYAI